MIELRDIYDALYGEEFFLEYQPIVMIESGHWAGVEALIRWRRPSGLVMPKDFIPVAENTPLSGLITYWVIERVAAELGDWLRAHSGLFCSINVPPEILGRGGLEYASQKAGLRELASQIILEITERGIPDQLGADALDMIPRFSSARIALDDVMLNGANIAVISRMHLDFVKIHPDLVGQINAGQGSPEWLARIAALQQLSPLKIIAEGIECREQAEALQQAGIGMGQGFHFHPPMSFECLEQIAAPYLVWDQA